MSLGAEDSAFDAGNPPDASEKAKYEEKKFTRFAAFCSLLQLFSSTHTFGTSFRRSIPTDYRPVRPSPYHIADWDITRAPPPTRKRKVSLAVD